MKRIFLQRSCWYCCMDALLDANKTAEARRQLKMLRAILNKSWRATPHKAPTCVSRVKIHTMQFLRYICYYYYHYYGTPPYILHQHIYDTKKLITICNSCPPYTFTPWVSHSFPTTCSDDNLSHCQRNRCIHIRCPNPL